MIRRRRCQWTSESTRTPSRSDSRAGRPRRHSGWHQPRRQGLGVGHLRRGPGVQAVAAVMPACPARAYHSTSSTVVSVDSDYKGDGSNRTLLGP